MSIYASSSILSCLIALPLVGALPLSLLPASRLRLIRAAALILLAGMLATGIGAAYLFNWSIAGAPATTMQLQQQILWLPAVGMYYHVGVDNLSMPLVLAVLVLAFLAGLAGVPQITRRGVVEVQQDTKRFYLLLIFLAGCAVGALVALDLLLFTAFVQLAVIPGYFLCALWGKQRSQSVAMKYALFQTLGSALIFLGIIGMFAATRRAGFSRGSLDMPLLWQHARFLALFRPGAASARGGQLIFWLIFAGLATRLPIVPLHLWLPDMVAESPASVSMLLIPANFIIGGYGMLRILLGMLPYEFIINHLLLAILGVVGLVYGGLCALAQTDLKRLFAYWTIAQAGYVLLGMAMLNTIALEGALVQLVGLAATFALVVWIAQIIEHRAYHCDINRLGGLARQMPGFFGASAMGLAAALGAPGLALFAGQIMVILGAFSAHGILSGAALWPTPAILGVIAAGAMVLTASYILWTFERVYLGSQKPEFHHFSPLLLGERLVLLPLVAVTLLLGIFPGIILIKPLSPAVVALLEPIWRVLGH